VARQALLEQLVQGMFRSVCAGAGHAALEVSSDLTVKCAIQTPLAEVVQQDLDVLAVHVPSRS
jgi:hypothetical protein